MSYFKVSKRWDSFDNREYSAQEYFYSGEPDGYPNYTADTISCQPFRGLFIPSVAKSVINAMP